MLAWAPFRNVVDLHRNSVRRAIRPPASSAPGITSGFGLSPRELVSRGCRMVGAALGSWAPVPDRGRRLRCRAICPAIRNQTGYETPYFAHACGSRLRSCRGNPSGRPQVDTFAAAATMQPMPPGLPDPGVGDALRVTPGTATNLQADTEVPRRGVTLWSVLRFDALPAGGLVEAAAATCLATTWAWWMSWSTVAMAEVFSTIRRSRTVPSSHWPRARLVRSRHRHRTVPDSHWPRARLVRSRHRHRTVPDSHWPRARLVRSRHRHRRWDESWPSSGGKCRRRRTSQQPPATSHQPPATGHRPRRAYIWIGVATPGQLWRAK